MVIEIVEEKLEQEYLENATKMMMGHMSENDRDRDSFDKQEKVDPWALPSHWEPMDVNGVGRGSVDIMHLLLSKIKVDLAKEYVISSSICLQINCSIVY